MTAVSFKVKNITFNDWALLQSGYFSSVHCGHATLRIAGKGEDARFVMDGPSGKHSLLVSETDVDRLNAHWQGFASHHLNRYG
jgi:hypothetical protein